MVYDHPGWSQDNSPEALDKIPTSASEGDVDRPNKIAENVLAQERAAAAGKSSPDVGKTEDERANRRPGNSSGQEAEKGSNSAELREREKASTSTTSEADSGSKPKKGRLQLTGRRKAMFWTLIIPIVLGGGGLFSLSVISGPLKVIHMGEFLNDHHLRSKSGQTESRMLKMYRNIGYLKKGQPQKTHMGTLGNILADKVEKKFNANGITSVYSSSGAFERYVIDPANLKGPDYTGIADRSPQGVQAYLRDNYQINADIDGDRLVVEGRGLGWVEERRLLKSTMALAGYRTGVLGLNKRVMGTRNLVGFHPIRKADKKIEDWARRKIQTIKNGIRPSSVTTSAQPDSENNPVEGAEENRAATDEFIQEANEATAGSQETDLAAREEARNDFRGNIEGRLGRAAGAADLAGLMCLAAGIAANIDKVNHANVVGPQTRMAMDAITTADQVKSSHEDVTEAAVEYNAKLQDNTKKGEESTAMDARSIQAEQGKPQSGPDLPRNAKLNPKGNTVTRLVDGTPGVKEVCKAVESPVGAAVTIGVGVIATGGLATLASVAIGAVAGPILIDQLTDVFANAQVDPLAVGALRGNHMNYGARLAGRDISLSNGGLPISEKEHDNLKYAELNIIEQEFKQKNLAYRLFNTYDRKSFLSQVVDKQLSDPRANIARAGSNLLDVGGTMSTLATLPFSSSVYAVANYDYGFPDYAFTAAELNDERFSASFENADLTADILDKNYTQFPGETPDNYTSRAKTCFGREIVKQTVDGREQWMIKPVPADPDSVPLQKTIQDPKNKCMDDSVSWKRVRFFIHDSNVASATACYEAEGDEPLLTNACVDTGMEPTTNTGTNLDAATTGDTGAGGTVALGTWKLTLPVGSSGKPKEIGCKELANFSEPPYFEKAGAGGYKMYVKSGGVTTSGSKNSRTEFREMQGCTDKPAQWSIASGVHEMYVTTNVAETKLPVVVGQIHGGDDDVTVFRVEPGGDLYATKGDDLGQKVGKVQYGTPFTVGFKAEGGKVHYFLNGKEVGTPFSSSDSSSYFKAGNYLQSNGRGDGESTVTITGLKVLHDGKRTDGGSDTTPIGASSSGSGTPGAEPATGNPERPLP